jgi:hypothetical protein
MYITCARSLVFSATPVSSTNNTDRHDITEILLKVALNTITPYIYTHLTVLTSSLIVFVKLNVFLLIFLIATVFPSLKNIYFVAAL